ncbi:hypothetical protein CFOL_v3_06889 [Cephalotus follicularis]|uniref:Uncharacterized protein n=1 Tax=Cephalotus follicularis TaxID=3775 RepID=A0A1Q3B5S5_CEPFO|nr:hypothetical protein CFOL_v3_06889 [Cephalotus follicularis]
MASSASARVTFRIVMAILVILIFFYVGRPLYWKLSATIHDIRHNKKTVSQGLSQIINEAQQSMVGWYHDESDSGIRQDRGSTNKPGHVTRRLLY